MVTPVLAPVLRAGLPCPTDVGLSRQGEQATRLEYRIRPIRRQLFRTRFSSCHRATASRSCRYIAKRRASPLGPGPADASHGPLRSGRRGAGCPAGGAHRGPCHPMPSTDLQSRDLLTLGKQAFLGRSEREDFRGAGRLVILATGPDATGFRAGSLPLLPATGLQAF